MMTSKTKTILLALILLVLFSSFASANKPNISFSFIPSSPAVNQDVNFTVTDTNNTIPNLSQVLWQFPDGNSNFSKVNPSNPFFYDFNANNFTLPPPWTVNGTWDASTGALVGSSGDAIAKNSFDYNGVPWNFHLSVSPTAGGVGPRFMIGGTISTTAGPDSPLDFNGYLIDISGSRANLIVFQNGLGSTLINNVHGFSNGNTYVFDINKSSAGLITMAIDGNTGGLSGIDNSFSDLNQLGAMNSGGTSTFDNFILTVPNSNVQTTVIHKLTASGNNLVCVTVYDLNNLNSTSCQTISTIGDVNIGIFDENTISPLIGATATLNGTVINQLSNGYLDLNQQLLIGDNVLSVTFPNKGDRTWNFYAVPTSNFDYNLVMLDSNKGLNVTFLVRDINGNVYSDANVNVVIKKQSGAINHGDYNVFDGFTDSSGMMTFFLNPNPANDANYVFFINKTGSSPLRYDDSIVTVTIPLDEAMFFPLTPYTVTVGGLGSGLISNTSTNTLVRILSNTTLTYGFNIDVNSQYYPRNYSVNTMGGADYNLQPYLATVSSSSVIAFTIKQLALPTLPIPDVVVTLNKNFNGTNHIIESATTDASGTITFSMINGDSYFLNFFYNGVQNCSLATSNPCNGTINTTFTQYDVLLDVNGSHDANQVQLSLFVEYTPTSPSITSCLNCQVNLSQEIQSYYAKIITLRITLSDGTILSSETRNYSHTFTDDIFNESINSNLISSNQWITIDVIVQGQNDENQTSSATYTVSQTNSFLVNLRNLRNDVGEVPLLILSIVITILLTGSMGIFFRDSGLTVLMSAIVMAFFTFGLGWVNPVAFFLACMSAFGAYLWYERQGT